MAPSGTAPPSGTADPAAQSPIVIYVGLGVAALGFIVLGYAWSEAAGLDYVQGQVPYLISGGMTGIGLVVVGLSMLLLQVIRADAAARTRELAELTATVRQMATALAPADQYDPTATGEYRPHPRERATGNGSTGAAPVTTGAFEPGV